MEHPDRVWYGTIDDDTYRCAVERTGSYTGRLTCTVTATGETLLDIEVRLTNDAAFGPDTGDVMEWQDLCIEVIDGRPST
jgi:hypothetical protein